MPSKIGILGGTFDPIHTGHLILAEYIKTEIGLDKVIFIPSKMPPHKLGADILSEEHRLHMVRLAVAGNPDFQVSDVEIKREGPSYTIHTLTRLQEEYGAGANMYFIMGADSAFAIETWYEANALLSNFNFIVGSRPGYREEALIDKVEELQSKYMGHVTRVAIPKTDIAATDIRRLAKEGKSIRYLVCDAVRGYIEEHGIYK